MKPLRNKIENFLRGETWLHLVTMFFILLMINNIFQLNNISNIFITIVCSIAKELFDKYEGKTISVTDIIGTLIGGLLATITLWI